MKEDAVLTDVERTTAEIIKKQSTKGKKRCIKEMKISQSATIH